MIISFNVVSKALGLRDGAIVGCGAAVPPNPPPPPVFFFLVYI